MPSSKAMRPRIRATNPVVQTIPILARTPMTSRLIPVTVTRLHH